MELLSGPEFDSRVETVFVIGGGQVRVFVYASVCDWRLNWEAQQAQLIWAVQALWLLERTPGLLHCAGCTFPPTFSPTHP